VQAPQSQEWRRRESNPRNVPPARKTPSSFGAGCVEYDWLEDFKGREGFVLSVEPL